MRKAAGVAEEADGFEGAGRFDVLCEGKDFGGTEVGADEVRVVFLVMSANVRRRQSRHYGRARNGECGTVD